MSASQNTLEEIKSALTISVDPRLGLLYIEA